MLYQECTYKIARWNPKNHLWDVKSCGIQDEIQMQQQLHVLKQQYPESFWQITKSQTAYIEE